MNPKTLFTIFFSIVLSFSFYFPQKTEFIIDKKVSKLFYTDDMVYPQTNKIRNINYVQQLIPPPQDTIPYLSTFMDYATNGNGIKQLLYNGDSIIASATYVDSVGASDPSHTSIRVIFNFSENNGTNWEFPTLNSVTSDSKSRFGDGSFFLLAGFKSVLFTGRYWNTPLNSTVRRAGVAYDIILGASSFTVDRLNGTLGFDLFGSKRLDNKTACIVKTPSFTSFGQDTLYYTTYDPHIFPYYSPLKVINTAEMENSACAYTIAASPVNANHLTAVYCYINDHMLLWPAVTKVRISTNGGDNWNSPLEIAPQGVIDGDSSGCYWNLDLAYKPGTSDPYVVFSAYTNNPWPSADAYRKSFKICIWNQNLNGGNPVVLADWRNIPILSNPSSFSKLRGFHVNSLALSHPSIGFKADGSRIFVSYSVCQEDTSALGFNFEDVYYQYSDNGGLNWSAPVNMTNSQNAVEKYPIVPKIFSGNLPPVMYQWDQIPGCQSFNDNVPVNRVYWVLKKDILTSTPNSELNNSPKNFSLHQNYPNPFNPSTKIKFQIPLLRGVSGEAGQLVTPGREGVFTSLKIFDILGREVRTLVNENLKPGIYEADFNAADLPSGIYFYTLNAGEFVDTKKMILIK